MKNGSGFSVGKYWKFKATFQLHMSIFQKLTLWSRQAIVVVKLYFGLTYFLTVLLETEQLTIAVTQYDRYFESSDDESSDADSDSDGDEIDASSHEVETYDVKRRICQQLQDTLKLTSPVCHSLINLVSGKWALKARKSTRNERNLSKHRKCLESYSSKASLSNEAASQGAAERLLLASGIKELEKR